MAESDGDATRLFFPLSTSVEFFRDPTSPDAEARVKQGAILFEELIFEQGIFDATLTPDGGSSFRRDASVVSDEELRAARVLHEEGTSFQFAMGAQPAKGVPAKPEAMHVMLDGKISRHYVAEWESVIRALAPYRPDWISGLALPHRLPENLRHEVSRLDFACLGDEALMPGVDTFERSFTYKSFNQDSVVAADIGAAFNITPQFVPMLMRQGIDVLRAGSDALDLWAPGVGALPWDVVLEFRDHAGAKEARAMLRQFEAAARDTDPEDLAGFRHRVEQQTISALTCVIQGMRPSLGMETVRQSLHTGVSVFVPVVGPAAGLAETAWHRRTFDRSWLSALIVLRSKMP